MSKTVFFDIDGTLIDVNKNMYSIPTTTREAMDQLKANGHDAFLATGRCKCFILPGVIDYDFSGYVTCNGAYVEYEDTMIYKEVIPPLGIKKTMELSDQYHFNYYFESNDFIYVRDCQDQKHIEFAQKWGMKPETIIDDFDYQTIETYIGMIVVNDKNDIPAMVDALSPYFDIQRHQSDYSFDLTLKGASKAKGIEKLMERLNRDMKDTVAFGDGRNDIEMLETVAMGIAMGNAVPEAKAVADHICDSVENDGITSCLKEMKLI